MGVDSGVRLPSDMVGTTVGVREGVGPRVRGMSVGLEDGDEVSADVGSAVWTDEGTAVG